MFENFAPYLSRKLRVEKQRERRTAAARSGRHNNLWNLVEHGEE
jgi:hypothetical protein